MTTTASGSTTTTTYYDANDDFTLETLNNTSGAQGTTVSAINVLGNITLSQDVGSSADSNQVKTTITVAKDVTLDLNGHSLYTSAANGIQVVPVGIANSTEKHTLTLKDSGTNGQIVSTYLPNNIGAISDSLTADQVGAFKTARETSGAIVLGYCGKNATKIGATGTDNEGGVGLVMLGGTITSDVSAVTAGNNSSIVMEDGTIESNYACGVYFGNNAPSKTGLDNSFTMTGGTIRTKEKSNLPPIQVSGTMTYEAPEKNHTTTLDISGGTIEFTAPEEKLAPDSEGSIAYKGNPDAIYAASKTDLKISGTANITSTVTGVEIRAGDLEVTGGTITTTATEYRVGEQTTAGQGATTYGVAIAVAQHNAKGNNATTNNSKSISVNISDGNITGPNALAISNPLGYTANQTHADEKSPITATIDGGTLTSNRKSGDTTQSGSGNAILTDKANGVVKVNGGTLNGNITVTKEKASDSGTGTTLNTSATVVVSGGTTNGTVQVVNVSTKTEGDTTTTTETPVNLDTIEDEKEKAAVKSALKVMGGKVTDTKSANNYVTPGNQVNANGTVEEIAGANGWSLQSSTSNEHYAYYVAKGTGSIISASINGSSGDAVTNNILRYDKTNRLFGIPSVNAGFNWVSEDNKIGYDLAIYNKSDDGRAVTIKPETSSVKISGTGFIDDKVVTLTAETTAQSLLGVEVDATDNNIAYMKGSHGNDKFIAGDRNTTLDGGEGDDTLEGNDSNDLFLYSKGQDQINNYTYDSDVVSLNGDDNLTPPIDFSKATYDGKKIIIDFDGGNKLTFDGAAKVAILNPTENGTDTYTYDAKSAGVWNYIAHEGHGISLGAGHTSTRYDGSGEAYDTIDASRVTNALRIIGNGDDNYIVGATAKGGTLEGNDGKDTLFGSGVAASLTLNGGAGDDLLIGGNVYNNFVYSEGKDAISGYKNGTDLINVDRRVSFADVNVSAVNADSGDNNDLLIKFDNDNQLSIAGGASAGEDGTVPVISIKSGRNNYAVTKDYIALNDKSVTLTADYSITESEQSHKLFNGAERPYETINAALVKGDISIVGNNNNNYIVGGLSGNSLAGGEGDDTLVGNTVGSSQPNLFYYTAGKDVIENFGENDKLDISADLVGDIKSGKLTNSKLTFTVDKNNSLTFKFGDNDPFGKVSLQSNGYLTKDGIASIKSGTDYSLDLFASAKGRIDLTDTLYSGASITSVNAESVKNQTVTLVGGSQGGTFTYAANKKRDGFEYGGGEVSISGYEGGKDRIDLNGASLTSFAVTNNNNDVELTTSNGKISIAGAAGQEIFLRDTSKGNGYKKMVFVGSGIVQDKKSNPTTVTVSSGATNGYSAANTPTVRKIFVTDVAAGASIQAGDRSNTIIDASKAAAAVSLSGGNKNDKLIGNASYADTFIYGAGKDVIQNFVDSENISITSSLKDSLAAGNVKITAGKKAIKFKFGNKDVLTIKSNEAMSGALNINGSDKIYFKNAIGEESGSVSLTSGYSGTFRTQDNKRTALPTASIVDGSKVEKNLTFVGSSANETLIGNKKKTMFKGGGGADSLVGGDGGKDTFFYAKGNEGNATISSFEFGTDKLKVSGGIIGNITKSNTDKTITFGMTKGKSTDAVVGSFIVNTSNASNIAIKANNTFYWFADGTETLESGDNVSVGQLITSDTKISAPTGYDVIDLNYSTNLVKSGVAIKVTGAKPK